MPVFAPAVQDSFVEAGDIIAEMSTPATLLLAKVLSKGFSPCLAGTLPPRPQYWRTSDRADRTPQSCWEACIKFTSTFTPVTARKECVPGTHSKNEEAESSTTLLSHWRAASGGGAGIYSPAPSAPI